MHTACSVLGSRHRDLGFAICSLHGVNDGLRQVLPQRARKPSSGPCLLEVSNQLERPGCPSKGNQVLYRSLGEDKSKVWGWQVNKMYTLVARLITIDSSQFEQPPLLGWLHESIQSSTLPQTLVFTVQEPPANRQDTKAKASPLYWGLV